MVNRLNHSQRNRAEYWNRKIAGQCVYAFCPEMAGETVYCETHRVLHNLQVLRSRRRAK